MDFEFTRGDTQIFKFQLKDSEGNILELTETDKLYFTVKQNYNSTEVLMQKVFPDTIEFIDDYYMFTITSSDTSELAYGTYNYDIELKSGDYVKTLALGTITLTEEITFKGDE